jgi:hypothetical protein
MGSSLTRLPVLLTLIVTTGLGLSTAGAQTSSPSATSGSGQYYVEFRSRQAWDYGHTFVVFGRVGEIPGKKNVAGLSPKGDDPKMWLMGHYMPVPADTGWTDGDLEDTYITSRYRVLINKDQYDRVVAHIRELQSRSHFWSVEMYNCNAFVADIAGFMGLKVPSSSWIYPRVFVSNLRKVNTGHPEAAAQLISDKCQRNEQPDPGRPRHDRRRHDSSRRRGNDQTDVTRSKRHHRRYSSLEPTCEFGRAYGKLERMSAPWAWHLTIEADVRRACSCRRALTLNQAHRVRTSPGICIRDPSGSQNTPLKGRGPQNMSRHGNFLIQMASPCGMLMQSRSEPKVTLDFCIDASSTSGGRGADSIDRAAT